MLKATNQTEQNLALFAGIDTWSNQKILEALVRSQEFAIAAAREAIPQISKAAEILTDRYSKGGGIYYVGAGTSIRIGVQDGSELPATYDIPEDRIFYLIAGGRDALIDTFADAEDDVAAGTAAADACKALDVMIAIAASGSTPYTCAAATKARTSGCAVISIVNNSNTKLGALADIEIVLNSGPEVIAGSTRMAAGTAQKVALNMLSTLANIKLGSVYDGLMVSMRAENEKLKARAARIVAQIADVSSSEARVALDNATNRIKPAVLLCVGARNLEQAQNLLTDTGNNLRLALAKLSTKD